MVKIESHGNTRDKTKMNPLKKDLYAAFAIGILASIFASIVVKSLNINIPLTFVVIGFTVLCIAGIFVARFLGQKIPIIYNFGKFGEAGGLNWLVDFGILNLLILITGINSGIYFSVFKGVSFTASATNSYFWNKFWVFEKGKSKAPQEVTKFILATVTGMIFNVLIASIIRFVGPGLFVGIEGNVWANIAAGVGSLTAMLLNFVLYKFWVFK